MMRHSYRKQNTRALIKDSPKAYKPYSIITLMKKIMVVAAYKLSHSGEGGGLPYDNFVVRVVDYNRTDADRVGVHHDSYCDSYFGNPFVLLNVMNRDAAPFVHALDDPLCAPAALGDLVPAATSEFPSESPSVAAGADT